MYKEGKSENLSIFIPGTNFYVIKRHGRKRRDECSGQTGVGEQRHIKVNRRAAYLVSVAEFRRRKILGHVDHHNYFFGMQQIDGLRLLIGL